MMKSGLGRFLLYVLQYVFGSTVSPAFTNYPDAGTLILPDIRWSFSVAFWVIRYPLYSKLLLVGKEHCTGFLSLSLKLWLKLRLFVLRMHPIIYIYIYINVMKLKLIKITSSRYSLDIVMRNILKRSETARVHPLEHAPCTRCYLFAKCRFICLLMKFPEGWLTEAAVPGHFRSIYCP